MGNTSSGHKRRTSLEDDALPSNYATRRPIYQFSTDSHGDDAVFNISVDDVANIDQSRQYGTSAKPTLYVGPPGGGPDIFEESQVPQSVPTVFKWDGGGKDVYISGTFNGWRSKIPMVRSSSKHSFYTIIDLPLGEHQYKFIVDGHWKLDQNQPIYTSPTGVQNNRISVKESDFDVLSALSHDMANSRIGEDNSTSTTSATTAQSGDGKLELITDNETPYIPGSGSPPGEYSRVIPPGPTSGLLSSSPPGPPPPDDSNDPKNPKSPPLLPPQLLQVILNRDTNVQCDPNLLPQPDHVMVNHMYALSIKDGVIVLSAITRYRQKFVSTVLYKPI